MSKTDQEFARAIETEDIYPVFQPVTDKNRNIVGFEILIRWLRNGNEQMPGDFLPLLSSQGSWFSLTASMIDAAIDGINQFNGQLFFAVNMTSDVLAEKGVLSLLSSAKKKLSRHEWSDCLILELSERTVMAKGGENEECIIQLINDGWRVELDDCFSLGSVFFPVRRVRFHGYKLDREIVSTYLTDSYDTSLIKSLVLFCTLTGASCTAEGIDTPEKFNIMSQAGVEKFQGFEISRPVKKEFLDDIVHSLGTVKY